MFGKGGVHEIGTVVFTVIAWGRRASAQNLSFAGPKCKLDAKTVMPPAMKRPRLRYAIAELCFGSARVRPPLPGSAPAWAQFAG